ncbi:MAG: thiamine-phosphate kinase [Proteobacteria bacterium]|nr:thiamine-phosphate kinase [Pseudomonadota bacterium]
MHSEQDYLNLIDRHFPSRLDTLDTVQLGRGDDCAILGINGFACVSSDLFLDGVHFRRSYFSPSDIGHKALAVNLSDIAAMGGVPRAFSLDLMVPEGLGFDFWGQFLTGMAKLAAAYEVVLVGGDLSRSPILGTSIHIWGEPGPSGRLLTRSAAQPGDLLVVAGHLGLARVGLHMLEVKGTAAIHDYPLSTNQHLRPRPRVAEGLILAANAEVHAMMDLSDGLARDLPRLLAASGNLGARLAITDGTLHDEVRRFSERQGVAPELTAMLGGEDYGLLAALSPEALRDAQRDIPRLEVIGVVTQEPGILLNDRPYANAGFDHFGE